MIYLSQFKDNLLAFVRLMIKSHMSYVDVSYRGRLYRFHMEDLGQEVKQQRRKRTASLVDKIETRKCPQCKKLTLNGICVNSLCISNNSNK